MQTEVQDILHVQNIHRNIILNDQKWEKKQNIHQLKNGQINCDIYIWSIIFSHKNKLMGKSYKCQFKRKNLDRI